VPQLLPHTLTFAFFRHSFAPRTQILHRELAQAPISSLVGAPPAVAFVSDPQIFGGSDILYYL